MSETDEDHTRRVSAVSEMRRIQMFTLILSFVCCVFALTVWLLEGSVSFKAVFFPLAALNCFGLAIVTLFRVTMLLLHFVRFTLGHLLGFVLYAGTAVSFLIVLPDRWKPIPMFALFVLSVGLYCFIVSQDPSGLNWTPSVFRKQLNYQRTG